MDAIALLLEDHATLRELLGELVETTSRGVKKRQALLTKLEANIKSHTTIEEEIFYPAFKEAGQKSDDDKMYFEALEEHRAAGELVLPDLLDTDPSSEQFSGRAKVLKEMIEHHAEEEEKEMFPRAKKLLDRNERAELGDQMERRRAELLGSRTR
jgi:hemerythrin-like domain-containing protein